MATFEALHGKRTPASRHPYLAGAAAVLAMFASRWLGEALELDAAGRLAVGLLPVPAFAWLIWTMSRWAHGLDELQQKIAAEALAIAYGIALLLAATLNSLAKAGVRVPLGWEDGMPILVILYLACFFTVSRRYQ